jgi:hypothetical protein
MKSYEYQILRYLPDRVSGEFVNVGLVLYCPEERFLAVDTARKNARFREFFTGLDTQYLISGLKHIQNGIETEADKFQQSPLLALPASIREITSALLPEDETALFFTPVKTGIDISAAAAFEELTKSMLFKYQPEEAKKSESDKDVWENVYKRYFQEQNILQKLSKHTIKTRHDSIAFDYAWKNEHWHCFSPVTFDLSKSENIKNKVYRWRGKLAELSTGEEPVEVHLLVSLPQDEAMKNFVFEMLKDQREGQAQLSIVQPEDAPRFSQQLKIEIDSHETGQ